MYKRAVVMCGGKGSRLVPYTDVLPKALLPVGDYPMLEIVIGTLKNYGFTHITLSVYHFAESIKNYFGNGEKWNLLIDYSHEDFPLGTAGPLKIIKDLPEDFLVTNCDVLTDLNLHEIFQHHVENNNSLTIAGYKKSYPIEYGVMQVSHANRLEAFHEKSNTIIINAAIYVLKRKIVDLIPAGQMYGFDDLIHKMLELNEAVSVYPFTGCWQDVGNIPAYLSAVKGITEARVLSL